MAQKKSLVVQNLVNTVVLLAVMALLIYWLWADFQNAANVILALIGLGTVIFLHEFGHFIAGKLCDIKVEAFAIGFGPVVLGFKKLKDALQVRILPTILVSVNHDEQGLLCFKIPFRCKQGETEYQLRIFPIGGFVKLLGQEDIGADKPTNDPRAFVNKPIWKRIVVASAGVAFNVVAAIILFIIVFTVGIKMPPAIVGGLVPGMPAEKAGLKPGDEILAVNGKSNIDFVDVAMSAALSGKDDYISLKVKHTDGSIEDVKVKPVASDRGVQELGIYKPETLEVANVSDSDVLFEYLGLKPADKIIAVEGVRVEHHWQFIEIVKNVLKDKVSVEIQRQNQHDPIQRSFNLALSLSNSYEVQTESDLSNIYSIVPRLRVAAVMTRNPAISEKLSRVFRNILKTESQQTVPVLTLQRGDIIVKVDDIDNPTFLELRSATKKFGQKDAYMPITVLREGKELNGFVKPYKDNDRYVIGIAAELDIDNPVVAKTVNRSDIEPLVIPSGARIISINNKEVSNYYDVIRLLRQSQTEQVKLEYRKPDSDKINSLTFKIPDSTAVGISSYLIDAIPFKPLERLYKASDPLDAVRIGFRKTVIFIVRTYITLKALIVGTVSPKSLMGPVGMVAASSKIIAEREFIMYFYFMGLISACLAVMNFLPLPILDGGLVVMLIIEKIKGAPIHAKIQEGLTYIGLVLIGLLFVIVTYNDIIRVVFGR